MPKPGLAAIDKKTRLATLWPILVGTVLVVGFFAAHQVWSTGFFTSQFGLLGTALFYSSLALGLTYPLGVQVVLSRHFSRSVELAFDISVATFWTITATWLLLVFPLNFSQLTAVVPGPLKFVLAWITNDVGRVLLDVALVGAVAFIPFYALQYFTTGRKQTMARHG